MVPPIRVGGATIVIRGAGTADSEQSPIDPHSLYINQVLLYILVDIAKVIVQVKVAQFFLWPTL